jgi:anti-sigma B factor antagonist
MVVSGFHPVASDDPVDPNGADGVSEPSPLLTVDRLDEGQSTTLRLSGELDLSSAGQLEAVIGDVQAQGRGPLTIDLAALTFMDSTGMAVLVRAHRAGAEAGRPVILANPGRQTRRLLELAGLLELFDVRG